MKFPSSVLEAFSHDTTVSSQRQELGCCSTNGETNSELTERERRLPPDRTPFSLLTPFPWAPAQTPCGVTGRLQSGSGREGGHGLLLTSQWLPVPRTTSPEAPGRGPSLGLFLVQVRSGGVGWEERSGRSRAAQARKVSNFSGAANPGCRRAWPHLGGVAEWAEASRARR